MPMMFVVMWFAILMALAQAQTRPDPKLTPGVADPKQTKATLCRKGFSTKSIRPPVAYTDALKKQQLAARSYKDKTPAHYEEDHLISLELGGDPRNPKNLWPEPYAGNCGARVKDKIEDKLRSLVCAGKITLKAAQRAIARDWVAAFNRYIGKLVCK